MNLFVDIGNSSIKWASESDIQSETIHRADSRAIPQAIDLPWSRMDEPGEVHIASVRQREIVDSLSAWIVQHWHAKISIAETKQHELGVQNGYVNPSQLGVDRWLALLAARRMSSRALIVVDMGTATTIDGLDDMGRHLGGVIIPGLQLNAKCLELNTDLSIDAKALKFNEFATDTATGIESGAMLSHLGVVERVHHDLEKRYEFGVDCIVTGGNAQRLSQYLKLTHQVVPNLVLRGLALQSTQVSDL